MANVVPGRELLTRSAGPEGFLKYLPHVALSGAAALVVTALWLIRTLNSPYWLDETGAYWATNAGLKEIPARCAALPLSTLYAGFVLLLRTLFGTAESVARVPSLLAIALATYVVFRDVKTRWGSEAAWIASVVLVAVPEVTFQAGDARPYAMGLLFVVLSTSLLPRFFGRPTYLLAALYGLTAALMVNMQLLYGAVLFAHLLYAALQWRRGKAPPLGYLAVALTVLAISTIPVALQMRSVHGHYQEHSFAPPPGLSDLITAFFPAPVLAGLIGAAAAAILLVGDTGLPRLGDPNELVLAGLICLIPPLLCFIAARALHLGVFLGRYFAGYVVGLAVCCGVLVGSMRPGTAARAAMFSLAVYQIVTIALLLRNPAQGHVMHRGDWAAAITFVDKNTAADGAPVLIRSQYIESDFYPVEPVAENPVFSQLVRYPSRARMTGLRATLKETEVEQTLNSVRNGGAFRGRLLLMSYDGPTPMGPLVAFVAGRLGPAFRQRELGDFDGVHVLEFQNDR